MSVQENKLKAIADAIREKDGTTEPIPANDFAARILAIQGGGDVTLESIAITAPPNKVRYHTGDLFDPTGMSVWAEFSNGYGLYVNHADLMFDPAGPLEEGMDSVTVRFSWGGETAETSQAISVTSIQIFGVEWDGGPSTKLSRTDDAVGFTDPVPAVGDGAGSSPFDNIMPWSGMVRVTQDGNELVAIPKYWIKVQHDPFRVQIADGPMDGYQVSPAHRDREDGQGERDVVYIGRYECDNSYMSRSGQAPKASTAIAAFRSGIHGLGAEYWQADFALQLTWWYLYLVEFADWNGQASIGEGAVNTGARPLNSGNSDSMVYHTGHPAGAYGTVSVQYRGIENPWGNMFELRDGIIFSDDSICTYNNPANFSNNYNDYGAVVRSNKRVKDAGWIKAWSHDSNDPSFIYPSELGGSDATFVPDMHDYSSGGSTLFPFKKGLKGFVLCDSQSIVGHVGSLVYPVGHRLSVPGPAFEAPALVGNGLKGGVAAPDPIGPAAVNPAALRRVGGHRDDDEGVNSEIVLRIPA